MMLNKILVLIDPTIDLQPAFERGLDSALDTGASLHLYACADEASGCSSLDEAHAKIQPVLDRLAARLRKDKIAATTELEWASDWAAQAATAALRCGASMIFKNSVDHNPVHREMRPTSDWTLLRMAPCPVLMVKNYHDWTHRRILAAINPATSEPAHIKLNHKITNLARQLATTYRSEAHFVTAFNNLNHTPDAGQIAKANGVGQENVHLKNGNPADVIRDVAAKLQVDLIIVGTVARDGIKGRVIGNTCERLLDQTHSDLLVLN